MPRPVLDVPILLPVQNNQHEDILVFLIQKRNLRRQLCFHHPLFFPASLKKKERKNAVKQLNHLFFKYYDVLSLTGHLSPSLVFNVVCVTQSLVFCVVLCMSFFILLSSFFLVIILSPLLSFFDLRLLISSNFSNDKIFRYLAHKRLNRHGLN